eukprot:6172228-Pleurochrysis_carterae.AAC.1
MGMLVKERARRKGKLQKAARNIDRDWQRTAEKPTAATKERVAEKLFRNFSVDCKQIRNFKESLRSTDLPFTSMRTAPLCASTLSPDRAPFRNREVGTHRVELLLERS